MTPQDKVPKCIPPSFYAACVADMNRQNIADHLRDPYLAIAFLSASLRAERIPEATIERAGKLLAQYLAPMAEDGASIWSAVEHFHNNPIDMILWLLNYEQTDGDA